MRAILKRFYNKFKNLIFPQHLEHDMRCARSGGAFKLPAGYFRLFQWRPKFNPLNSEIQTHTQVWIRINVLN